MGANKGLLVALAVTLFSLAAIPPFVGFFAKLAVLSIQIYWLAVIAVLASTLSAANYLSLVTLSLFNLTLITPLATIIAPFTAYLISVITLLLLFGSIISRIPLIILPMIIALLLLPLISLLCLVECLLLIIRLDCINLFI